MEKFVETKRIILRKFSEEDLNDLYEYASVSGVGEMAGWPTHKSIEESKTVLDMFINQEHQYALVLKETGKMIGSFSLKEVSESIKAEFEGLLCCEFGYTVSKDYWGQGIMPEVTSAVIDFLFNKTDVDVITIEHFVDNKQSQRVIEKCGGVFYKNDVFDAKLLGKKFDTKRYLILKEDYMRR